MILAFTTQYIVYGEYPAGQGFADMYIAKAANSLATYEAVVELKYLNKEKARKFNFKKSIKEARQKHKERAGTYVTCPNPYSKYNMNNIIIAIVPAGIDNAANIIAINSLHLVCSQ